MSIMFLISGGGCIIPIVLVWVATEAGGELIKFCSSVDGFSSSWVQLLELEELGLDSHQREEQEDAKWVHCAAFSTFQRNKDLLTKSQAYRH